jgi:mannose-1-phosphate guanylyltransferase/mannose-1-phosphate guanylyltransferase/mannose-6-phosphate isomerase
MAGGSGTRLWPASNSKRPKQFLPAPGGGCFLSGSVRRALEITEPSNGRVIITSRQSYEKLVAEACCNFSEQERRRITLITEPEVKNTAPAIAFGLIYNDWESGGMNRNVLVLTSDHIIEPLSAFKANAEAAAAFAGQDKLVIFGIAPKSPETGYGYIETGEALPVPGGGNNAVSKGIEPAAYKVLSFKEKPDAATAAQYLKAGNFFWNSGMFAFSSKFMMEEFRRTAAGVCGPLIKLHAPCEGSYKTVNGLRVLSEWPDLDKAYAEVKAISFDCAIVEKCAETVAVKADFGWTDIGNWDEYIRLEPGKTGGGNVFSLGSSAAFVDSDIPTALIGADDFIVVIRSGKDGGPAAALIVKKGETQKVKDIVEQLKSAGRSDLT